MATVDNRSSVPYYRSAQARPAARLDNARIPERSGAVTSPRENFSRPLVERGNVLPRNSSGNISVPGTANGRANAPAAGSSSANQGRVIVPQRSPDRIISPRNGNTPNIGQRNPAVLSPPSTGREAAVPRVTSPAIRQGQSAPDTRERLQSPARSNIERRSSALSSPPQVSAERIQRSGSGPSVSAGGSRNIQPGSSSGNAARRLERR